MELHELPDWNCCGASSAHASDEALAADLARRNLSIADKQGMDVVVPCAACYNRLKAAETDAPAGSGAPRRSSFRVLSLLDAFCTPEFEQAVLAGKKRDLKGLNVVSYYGCLLVRPPKVTGALHHEFPETMDRLATRLGARAIPWSYKTDCCGGSLVLARKEIVLKLTHRLLEAATRAGADAIIVACPLCQANLDTRQDDIFRESGTRHHLPVLYFTELIGLSLGCRDTSRWFRRHLVDPTPLVTSKHLM